MYSLSHSSLHSIRDMYFNTHSILDNEQVLRTQKCTRQNPFCPGPYMRMRAKINKLMYNPTEGNGCYKKVISKDKG